jgi:hypothetical protein
MRQMHLDTFISKDIDRPIPTPGGFHHHHRIRAGLRHHPGQHLRRVIEPPPPQTLAPIVEAHRQRTATMQINTHISCHQGPPPTR